jgi:hypothetical protein
VTRCPVHEYNSERRFTTFHGGKAHISICCGVMQEGLRCTCPTVYRIEKGVPVPKQPGPPQKWPDWRTRYPLEDMAVGDSFLVPHLEGSNLRTVIAKHFPKTSRQHCRFYVAAEELGVRVWRTA